jgi:hypothetical protein
MDREPCRALLAACWHVEGAIIAYNGMPWLGWVVSKSSDLFGCVRAASDAVQHCVHILWLLTASGCAVSNSKCVPQVNNTAWVAVCSYMPCQQCCTAAVAAVAVCQTAVMFCSDCTPSKFVCYGMPWLGLMASPFCRVAWKGWVLVRAGVSYGLCV